LTALALAALPILAAGASQAEMDDARARGIAWLIQNQQGDGSWYAHESLKVQSTATALEALMNAGMRSGETFGAGLAWLANAGAVGTDGLARQIATLAQAGMSVTPMIERLIGMRNSDKAWGAYAGYDGTAQDSSLAMDAVFFSQTSYDSTKTSVDYIINKQNTDGGWGYLQPTGGSVSRFIPSAHGALFAARYAFGGLSGLWVKDADLTEAVNWLLGQIKADGGFNEELSASSGSAYETALAHLALSAARNAGNSVAKANAGAVLSNAESFFIGAQGVLTAAGVPTPSPPRWYSRRYPPSPCRIPTRTACPMPSKPS
jgi:hypothetical protein